MIEKTIHYCWFGGNPLPPLAKKCIRSWKKYCPDYNIVRWDESNFDVNCNAWCSAMYQQKKWAFLSDYARLKIVYENGGIYLDTDVELVKSLDCVISNDAFMGLDTTEMVANGLGFGANKKHPFIYKNMLAYETVTDFSSPELNSWITTRLLTPYGIDCKSNMIQCVADVTIYPPDFFCCKHTHTGAIAMTPNSVSIHHFNCSWDTAERRASQNARWKKYRRQRFFCFFKRALRKIIGDGAVDAIKKRLGRK